MFSLLHSFRSPYFASRKTKTAITLDLFLNRGRLTASLTRPATWLWTSPDHKRMPAFDSLDYEQQELDRLASEACPSTGHIKSQDELMKKLIIANDAKVMEKSLRRILPLSYQQAVSDISALVRKEGTCGVLICSNPRRSVISLPFWLLACILSAFQGFILLSTARSFRRTRSTSLLSCGRCGYNLIGTQQDRCSECGCHISKNQREYLDHMGSLSLANTAKGTMRCTDRE
jgi:ribosomal protein L37E